MLWLALSVASCAEGYPSASKELPGVALPGAGRGSVNFKGEACQRGQEMNCVCPDGVTAGYKLCTPDPESPTQASFSGCLSCPEPEPPPNPETMPMTPMMPAAGGMGGGGIGAAMGGRMGAAGRGTAGSGGRGTTSGGSSGRGATGSGRGSSGGRCMCADQACFPVGVIGCCRLDGSCGCTWAPGAYCL